MTALRTIDAHSGGTPLRLIVDGFPAPPGRTMADKLLWARRHADHLRRTAVLEPRGHADMWGAVLTEPVSPGSHAGVLFMHGGGYAPAFDHGIVALTTIALERQLIVPAGDGDTVVFDTTVGAVRARATRALAHDKAPLGRVSRITCTGPPAFVVRGGVVVKVGGRAVPVDLAFGGACYAVVDSESAGLGLTPRYVADLRRVGEEIRAAAEAEVRFVHPGHDTIRGVHGVVFTGPAGEPHVDLRAVTVFGDRQVAVSPVESATAALLAVLEAIGLLPEGARLTTEGLTGEVWTARIAARSRVGDFAAIVPEMEGTAWRTGELTMHADPDDPLAHGFRL